MTSKYFELALKLRELWRRAEGAEAFNAKEKLDALLAKHGITMEDLEGTKVQNRTFNVTQKERDIFFTVITNIFGSGILDVIGFTQATENEHLYLDLNDADFIETEAKYEFFKQAFHEEYMKFLNAFVIKQDLFAKDIVRNSKRDLTERDYEILMIARKMRRRHFTKQIGNGSRLIPRDFTEDE